MNCTVEAAVYCTGGAPEELEYCTGLPELAAGVYWTGAPPAATALYWGAITCWPLTTLLYCSGADVGVLAGVLDAGACGGGGGTKEV